jgi:hypothetical protein
MARYKARSHQRGGGHSPDARSPAPWRPHDHQPQQDQSLGTASPPSQVSRAARCTRPKPRSSPEIRPLQSPFTHSLHEHRPRVPACYDFVRKRPKSLNIAAVLKLHQLSAKQSSVQRTSKRFFVAARGNSLDGNWSYFLSTGRMDSLYISFLVDLGQCKRNVCRSPEIAEWEVN